MERDRMRGLRSRAEVVVVDRLLVIGVRLVGKTRRRAMTMNHRSVVPDRPGRIDRRGLLRRGTAAITMRVLVTMIDLLKVLPLREMVDPPEVEDRESILCVEGGRPFWKRIWN